MNTEKYLNRIQFQGEQTPSYALLHQLFYQHVSTIPYENINRFLRIPVSLSIDDIYKKIVEQKRGGGCYELNGLFHHLLQSLGFNAELLSAKLYRKNILEEESVHAVIRVCINEQTWFLDTGYGADGLLYPIMMNIDEEQRQDGCIYRFSESNHKILFSRSKDNERWENLLLIDPEPVNIDFFNARNQYHQTELSEVGKNLICSLPSAALRKSLMNNKYTYYSNTGKNNQLIENEDSLLKVLTAQFGININKQILSSIFSKLSSLQLV